MLPQDKVEPAQLVRLCVDNFSLRLILRIEQKGIFCLRWKISLMIDSMHQALERFLFDIRHSPWVGWEYFYDKGSFETFFLDFKNYFP